MRRPKIGRALVDVATGTDFTGGELMDIDRANVSLVRGAIARHGDIVIGVKARPSQDVAGTGDLEGLRHAQEVATSHPPTAQAGRHRHAHVRIAAERRSRRAGAPHPRGWQPRAAAASFLTLATDSLVTSTRIWRSAPPSREFGPNAFHRLDAMSRTTGVIDFPDVLSILMFDISLARVVACATTNAARVFDAFCDRGRLNIGAPADVAIMELREGSFEFLDNYEVRRNGRQRLFPIATVLNGNRVAVRT
jgi:dihydroorotase